MKMSSWTVLRNVAQVAGFHLANRYMIQQQQRLVCSLTAAGSSLLVPRVLMLNQQRYAARKGTRERKVKKKVKAEIAKKEEFVPYKIKLAKLHVPEGPRRIVEVNKPQAIDDVYFSKHFMTVPVTLADAVQFHRETNHPSVYDSPEALLTMKVELNMQMEKKNRYMDNFARIVLLPHNFEYQPVRKVLAFCKTQETQEEATKAGADAVGGLDLIKRIQSGEVPLTDYEYFVAHTNMMADILPLRGLLKRKLPNLKNGSMGVDIPKMIEVFSKGLEFSSTKDAYELDYGLVEVPFGRLTMPMEELEANFATILKDIETCRARTSGAFITRCYVLSPPSPEFFVVKTDPYVNRKADDSSSSSSSDDENDNEDEDADEEKRQDTSRARVAKQ
uniref:EOG090X089S n=1 Tax=Daphnia barbata TaxID=414587 RepID=A0A4Y7M3D2_9CRUS|nr:EOG090X089S [Daphnia barbata]